MKLLKLMLGATIAAIPVMSVADDGARIGIRATVPTICRVDSARTVVTQGNNDYDLGQVTELCNNVGGYRIVLSHPQGLTNAEAIVDGVAVPLSTSGQTTLVDSNVPAQRIRQVRIKFGANVANVSSISLQAVPKGHIY